MHAEAAPGQFEVVTRYRPALEAADELLYTREAISAVAVMHGLVACFLPKMWADQAGNGCHMHTSLWRRGRNVHHAARHADSTAAAGALLHPKASKPSLEPVFRISCLSPSIGSLGGSKAQGWGWGRLPIP